MVQINDSVVDEGHRSHDKFVCFRISWEFSSCLVFHQLWCFRLKLIGSEAQEQEQVLFRCVCEKGNLGIHQGTMLLDGRHYYVGDLLAALLTKTKDNEKSISRNWMWRPGSSEAIWDCSSRTRRKTSPRGKRNWTGRHFLPQMQKEIEAHYRKVIVTWTGNWCGYQNRQSRLLPHQGDCKLPGPLARGL